MNINLYEIRPEDNIIDNNSLLDDLFLDCQCALFLVDMTNYKTLEPIKTLFVGLEKDKYPYLKKILVETKSDLEKESQNEEIQNIINKYPDIDHITISAKKGNNINDLLLRIYNEVNSPQKNSIPVNIVKKNKLKENLKEEKDASISLILLGNSGVGKTNFLMRLAKNIFQQQFLSTLGVNNEIKTYKIKDQNTILLTLWDTSGQERYRSMPRSYFKNVDGILLFFDVNDIESFKDTNIWLNEIEQYGTTEDNKKRDIILYLIGNKIDFAQNDEVDADNIEGKRKITVVTKKEKEELVNKLGVKYYEISCKWNMNIEEVMARIILDCSEKMKLNSKNIQLTKMSKNKNNEGGCCGSGQKGSNKEKKKPIKKRSK